MKNLKLLFFQTMLIFIEVEALGATQLKCSDVLNVVRNAEMREISLFDAVYRPFETIMSDDLVNSGVVLIILDSLEDSKPERMAPRQSFWTLENRFPDAQVVEHLKVLSYLSLDMRLSQEANDFKTTIMRGLSYDELEAVWADNFQQNHNPNTFVEVNGIFVKVSGVDKLFSLYDTSGMETRLERDVTDEGGEFIANLVSTYGEDRVEYIINSHSHPNRLNITPPKC